MDEGKLRRCHEHMARLAEECGSIRQLLMVFFSFLHRMTDFYVVDASPRKPMGFDPGVAERMVRAGSTMCLTAVRVAGIQRLCALLRPACRSSQRSMRSRSRALTAGRCPQHRRLPRHLHHQLRLHPVPRPRKALSCKRQALRLRQPR